jgi:hypothetical protein
VYTSSFLGSRCIITSANGDEALTSARMIGLDSCDLDKVMFVLTGLKPNTQLKDLRARSKFDIKTKLKREHARLGDRRYIRYMYIYIYTYSFVDFSASIASLPFWVSSTSIDP